VKDLNTTLAGFITSAVALLAYYGFNVPPEIQAAILPVGLAVFSYLAKDK
jgi:hypothetical protein